MDWPRFRTASASLFALSLAASGCGPTDDSARSGVERVGRAHSAIADGYVDSEDAAVVSVIDTTAERLCTGSLIAGNLVLTARHCVAESSDGGVIDCDTTTFGPAASAKDFVVSTRAEVADDGSGNGVSMILTIDASDAFCGNDMAALVLSEPIGSAEAVPLTARLDDGPEVDDMYSAVGFGGVNDAGSESGLRRRRDDIRVTCLGDACPGGTFAAPEVTDTEFVGDAGACIGDSGGPAIDSMGRVMGVTSRGLSKCSRPAYSSTFAWAGWIKDAGVIAAGAGQYPPPAWTSGSELDPKNYAPVGESCEEDADCYSGVCIDALGGPECTRHCDERAPCPDDYQCAADGDVCVPASSSYPRKTRPEGCAVGKVGGDPRGRAEWLLVGGLLWGLRRRYPRRRERMI